MNELKIFNNQEFGQVRAELINNEPYVMLADVCKALDISNVAYTKSRLKEDGVRSTKVIDSLGREQEATFINESNMYKVIFQSRKPNAEKFTDWVVEEVLPSIRKHGAYIPEELSPQLQFLINMELKQKQLEATIEETKQEVQAIRDTIVINPKAEWRKECGRILRAIGTHIGDYRKPNEEAYKALEERGHCRPSVLISNLQNRASRNGMVPSKVANLNLLDVLENEPRLKEIYISIAKEMAIKYKVA